MDFTSVKSLLEAAIYREPFVSLWLAVTAVILFGTTYARSKIQLTSFWAWVRRFAESLLGALGFIAVLGIAYFLLNSSYVNFRRVYASYKTTGSISNLNWKKWVNQYGGPFSQQDVKVALFTSDNVKQSDQSGNLVQTTETRFPPAEKLVTQTSISGFRGLVTINLQDKSQPSDRFNAYTLDALYEYEIINPTEMEARVVFRFPLSSSTMIYKDIQFRVNGEELPSFQIVSGMITWNGRLKPGETASISIHYLASGMDWFGYYSGDSREVKDFSLTVRIDDDGNYTLLTLPDNGGIKLTTRSDPPYTDITWTIDKAILAPNLAISLNQNWTYAPYGSLIDTLGFSSRALIYCISLIVLTLMIFGVAIRLKQVVLLSFLFAVPYFILMSGVLTAIAQSKYGTFQLLLLPVLAIIPLLLVFIILRQQARLAILQIVIVLSLMALYTIGYPRIGLLSDEPMRNSAEGIVQVLMIGYVFALALAIRIRMVTQSKRKKNQSQAVK